MHKIACLVVCVLLIILTAHREARAANTDPINTITQPVAKIKSKRISNPSKYEKEQQSSLQYRSLSAQPLSQVVSVYDVWFNLIEDTDGDGYFHQFEVSFDVDTQYAQQEIYVVGKLIGATSQQLFETEHYHIESDSGADSYQTTVLLSDGYPSGEYNMELNVYDAQTDTLLLHVNGQHDQDMWGLYLEDAKLEHSIIERIEIYELAYELSEDWDDDGFYTHINLSFDADAPNQTRRIYAHISLRDPYGNRQLLSRTDDFVIQHYDSGDYVQNQLTLEYGFDPDHYQLIIDLYDAYNHHLLLTSNSPLSTPLNLESIDWDSDYSVYIEEEYSVSATGTYRSGGSSSVLLLGALIIFICLRYKQKSNK
jgi:hypothetical protein